MTMRPSREDRIRRIRMNEGQLVSQALASPRPTSLRGYDAASPYSAASEPYGGSRLTSFGGVRLARNGLSPVSPYSVSSEPSSWGVYDLSYQGGRLPSRHPTPEPIAEEKVEQVDLDPLDRGVSTRLLKTIKAKQRKNLRAKQMPVTSVILGPEYQQPIALSPQETKHDHMISSPESPVFETQNSRGFRDSNLRASVPPSDLVDERFRVQRDMPPESYFPKRGEDTRAPTASDATQHHMGTWSTSPQNQNPPSFKNQRGNKNILRSPRDGYNTVYQDSQSPGQDEDLNVYADNRSSTLGDAQGDNAPTPPPSPPSPLITHSILPKGPMRPRHVTFDLEIEKDHKFSPTKDSNDGLLRSVEMLEKDLQEPNGVNGLHNEIATSDDTPVILGAEIQQLETQSIASSISTTPDRISRLRRNNMVAYPSLADDSPERGDVGQESDPGSPRLILSSTSRISQVSEEPSLKENVSNVDSFDSDESLSNTLGKLRARTKNYGTGQSDTLTETTDLFGSNKFHHAADSVSSISNISDKVYRSATAAYSGLPTPNIMHLGYDGPGDHQPADSDSSMSNASDREPKVAPLSGMEKSPSTQQQTHVTTMDATVTSSEPQPAGSDTSPSDASGQEPTISVTNVASISTTSLSTNPIEPRSVISEHQQTVSKTNQDGDDERRAKEQDGSTKRKFSITVIKESPTDKIGVHVGKKLTNRGYHLVVSKITPGGPLVDSPMEVGDVVLSINGVSFTENPETSDARDIVRDAKEVVKFVLRRPAVDELYPDLRLPSLPQEKHSEMTMPSTGQTVTTESWEEDGSVTISREELDEVGSVKNRRVERKLINSDGSITLSMDEQSLDGSATQMSWNESINISGMMSITVSKRQKDEKVGLLLSTREGPLGDRVLFIAGVDPSGLFASTPLRVGDIVLSINSTSFREDPDACLASSIVRNLENDLTIVARKSDSGLRDFLIHQGRRLQSNKSALVGAAHEKGSAGQDATNSVLGEKETSFMVTVKKRKRSQKLGLAMAPRRTNFGAAIVATKLSRSGLMKDTSLQVGDIILAINGVDLEKNPDTDLAAATIESAPDVVDFKVRRVHGRVPSLNTDDRPKKTQVTQTILPHGQKVVKTETFNSDGTSTVKVEEFSPPLGVHVPLKRSNSDVSGLASISGGASLDMSDITGFDTASFDDGILRRRQERDPGNLRWGTEREESLGRSRGSDSDSAVRPSQVFLPEVDSKGSKPNILVVYKKNPLQEVGISLSTVKGTLRVTKVSPTGLFAGKPVLPGDTILSINSISFREQPNEKTARVLMDNAKDEIRIEVLNAKKDKVSTNKRKLWNRFKSKSTILTSKWRTLSFRRQPSGEARTPDTSMEDGYC